MSEYNVSKAILAQEKYCKEHDAPHFAPYTGICYRCHRNIYEPWTRKVRDVITGEEKEITSGITVEKAATELVTGCPHCHMSYCD